MAFRKYVKRAGRAIKRFAKKRYVSKKGGYKYGSMLKDASTVAKMASMLNAEKKRIDIVVTGGYLGQVSTNSSGVYVADITPVVPEGVAFAQRTGASIKLSTSFFEFQIQQMAVGQPNPIKLKCYIVQIKGQPITAGTFPQNMFNQNPWASAPIQDYNSSLNPDYFGTYKIIRTLNMYLKDAPSNTDTSLATYKMGMKYGGKKNLGHHIRYNGDTNAVFNGQLLMVIVADNGNSSNAAASTLTGIPVTAINTGARVNYLIKHYYYDN